MNTHIPMRRVFAMLAASLALMSVLAGCGSTSGSPAATPTLSPSATPVTPKALYVASSGLMALDPTDGHKLWEQALVGTAWGTPVISGNSVVQTSSITSSSLPHARLDAFNATTGAPLWHQEFGFDTQAFLGVSGATVIVVTSAVSTTAPNAPVGVTLQALSSTDGKELWRQSLSDTDIFLPICASDGKVYLLTASSHDTGMRYRLSAFDAASGTLIWNKALGGGTALGFASGSGGVYVSLTPGHIPALWRANAGAPANATVLTAAMSQERSRESATDATLTAYRAQDGAQIWQVTGFITVQTEAGGVVSAVQNMPQSGGAAFTEVAYDAQSGHQRWQSAQLGTGDLYQDKPIAVASNAAIYIFNAPMSAGDAQPRAYALQPASGAKIWMVPLGAHVSDSMASATAAYVVAERAAPTNITRTLMALNGATGAPLWEIPLTGAARIALGYT